VETSFPKDGQQSLKQTFHHQQNDSTAAVVPNSSSTTTTPGNSNLNNSKQHHLNNNMQLKMNNLASEDLPVSFFSFFSLTLILTA
jgi:hypothetical protein